MRNQLFHDASCVNWLVFEISSIVSSYPAARLRVIRAERVAGVRE